MHHLLLTAAIAFLVGCTSEPASTIDPADTVFLGDNIMTMDDSTEGSNAVAVRGDTIVAVG